MAQHGLTYATDGSNAVDVRCMEDITVSTEKVVRVPLGFAMSIPEGYAALLLPRSGLGFKFGVEFNNTIGLIDSDYRGELVAAMRLKQTTSDIRTEHAEVYFTGELKFKAGDRIAQLAIVPIPQATFTAVDDLDDTKRGDGGIGSTGKE